MNAVNESSFKNLFRITSFIKFSWNELFVNTDNFILLIERLPNIYIEKLKPKLPKISVFSIAFVKFIISIH